MKTSLFFILFSLLSLNAMALDPDYALQFDGTNDIKYNTDATLDILDGSTTFTMEAWIKPTGNIAKAKNIFRRWNQYQLSLYTNSAYSTESSDPSNSRRFYLKLYEADGTTTRAIYNSSDNAVTLNQWNHIAVVADGTSIKLYCNGIDVSDPTNPAPVALSANSLLNNFYIAYAGTGTFFIGLIDKIRITKDIIDPVAFQTTVTSAAYTTNTNTVALFNFNEGTGNVTQNEASGLNSNTFYQPTTPVPWIDLTTVTANNSLKQTLFSLSPNPAKDFVQVQSTENISEVLISDITGKQVKTLQVGNQNSLNIDIHDLNYGIYIVSVKTNKGKELSKLVVK
jgi:LEA14-like dessication related protein